MAAKPSLRLAGAEPLVTFVTTDYTGITRGRSITRRAYEKAKGIQTCGWVPANISLTPFDQIADPNPWGSQGDLRLLPDPNARYCCWPQGAATPLDIVMSDIVELDGSPWDCCTRSFLKAATAEFKRETGFDFIASFEQEFQILGAGWRDAPSFSLSSLRRSDPFGPEVMAALEQAGVEPETFLTEYGKDQFEITVAPAPALIAADRCVATRAIVREAARLKNWHVSFAPKTSIDGVGNGVHAHFSFAGPRGANAAFDAKAPGRMSATASAFAAGILRHMPAMIALTAPSPISYLRLKPHNWSSSWTWLGERDREASLRICPTTEIGGKEPSRQFNLEYRAADATASPHLILGAMIRAGLEAIRAGLPSPRIFSGDPERLDDAERQRLGLRRLPQSLSEALQTLESDKTVAGWFTRKALETFTGLKLAELRLAEDFDDAELCRRYAAIY